MIPSIHRSPPSPKSRVSLRLDDEDEINQLKDSPRTVQTTLYYTPTTFSPGLDGFSNTFGSMNTPLPYCSDGYSAPLTHNSAIPSPFNFSQRNIADNQPTISSIFQLTNLEKNIGKRRGHRYKHSSVSTQHRIFLEPPQRAPLVLPVSLPVPTYKEAWSSRSKEQTRRIACCVCHACVALYVFYSAAGSLTLTALSHLIFFDAVSAIICVAVEVLSNFEVWKRSSIRHPFGLERVEVLAGFAMSVFLLFMGFDLISHNLKHALVRLKSVSGNSHSHHRVSRGSVDSAALLSIFATLISAFGLQNHARIGKTMRYNCISFLPSILSNPSHFLTLFSSTVMLLLPYLSVTMYHWIDRLLCTLISISMFALGVRFATTQGLILLMSYSGEGVHDVIREIKSESMVVDIEEAKFSQVHYALCIANLKLKVKQEDDSALTKLRKRIDNLIKTRLGDERLKSEVKWEQNLEEEEKKMIICM